MGIIEKLSLVKVSGVTHKLILLLLAFNVAVLAGLPLIVQWVIRVDIGSGYVSVLYLKPMYYYFLGILYFAGGLALIILNDLRLLLSSCIREDVFVRPNVVRLLRMAICTGVIALVFMTKIFIVNSIMTMVVVFVFFMASVFCLVLTLLFDQAVHYKMENDLTI